MREPAEIVFLHLDNNNTYSNDDFVGLPKEIKRRPFQFKILNAKEARRAMRYAGHQKWEPSATEYCVPDDGINHLHDCDLWLVVSDRLPALLLPTQPIILMIYDYLQRYVPFLIPDENQLFISAARLADRVLVTTDFTKSDALQYSGITPSKVCGYKY